MKPMKVSHATDEHADALLDNDGWVLEQKMDGARALARVEEDGTVTWLNSSGGPMKFAAAALHLDRLTAEILALVDSPAGQGLPLPMYFDGELIPGTGEYHIFDLVWPGHEDMAYAVRRGWLRVLFARRTTLVPSLSVVRSVYNEEKREVAAALREANVEGYVLKNLGHPYLPGQRSKEQIKVKFVKTADVVVTKVERGRNEAGREVGNIEFGVYHEDGTLLPVGTCSAIGKPHVEPGDVIEVAYLYRDDKGGLIQPRMVRVREDKPARSCEFDQFPRYSRAAL